jgi:hypothetical protein
MFLRRGLAVRVQSHSGRIAVPVQSHTLLDEADQNDRLMRAKVLRELGEFESANEVLSRVTSTEYTAVVHQLRSLCDTRDAWIRELQFDG